MCVRTMKTSSNNKNTINLSLFRLRLAVFLFLLTVQFLVSFGAKFIVLQRAKDMTSPRVGTNGNLNKSYGRHLLGITRSNLSHLQVTDINCTPPAINDFPSDLFSDSERRQGAVFLHAFLSFYLFTLLAIVCDNYFVPSIKKITKMLHISKDVAGATFMAAATSSPELFINSVGTFLTESDIGIGTIVGSGVFNILAVPACCGLIAGKSLPLDWWPLTRDSIAYGITVILLILTMIDGQVSWQEAIILVSAYIAYITFICFNGTIKKLFKHNRNELSARNSEESQLLTEELMKENGLRPTWSQRSNIDTEAESSEDEDTDVINLWQSPRQGRYAKFWWILTWPISFLLSMTIPDCRQQSKQYLFPVTFFMCILYIGSASYIVSWMITVIGDTARIPDSVMGLTFLAAGTSLPEAVSSIIVTNQGYGSMGLSNSIGSNTFDILLCLGFPWLIKSTLFPIIPGHNYVIINSKGFEYNAATLLSALLILYATFVWNKFRLNRKVGLICLIVYFTFLIIASLNELNFFYEVNLPTCGW